MSNPNLFNEKVGLLRRGWIYSYDDNTGKLAVKLNNAPLSSANPPVSVQAPHSMFYNNGLFMGTRPNTGTPVVVGQGSGGEYFFVSFLAENLSAVPTLNNNELLIRASDNTKITLDTSNNINLGSDSNRIHINTTLNYMSRNFHNDYKFTKASRRVEGVIKRDLIRNTNFDQNSKLESDNYDQQYYVIALDPTATPSQIVSGSNKNPAFVESRNMIYEFEYHSDIQDDLNEATVYSNTSTKNNKDYFFPNRRASRADTLSLSLVSPNYLMESIKGTVVDIFGNILDLNRNPLPVGKDQNTLRAEKGTDKSKAFINIKALQRKSLAYHFEINTRKDLSSRNGIQLPDINSNSNYSRDRSRFFIDIDKEGQFKINVPASSESGNIPLLTRYENYSTYGPEDNFNPNKLIQIDNNVDIFHDSFASQSTVPSNEGFSLKYDDGRRGSIDLKTEDGADAAPIDRITKQHIKHGMAHHDILSTCFLHQNNEFLNYQAGEVNPLTVDLNLIPELEDIVSTTIITSGVNPNGGGRSGSINLDGSIEVNIGANTIDRQSLWLDTAGGMVANIGRDRNGRSIVAATGGEVHLQIGGYGITADSRFVDQNNGVIEGVLDLRVMGAGGYCHIFRIDREGVTFMTPGNMKFHAKKDITFTSDKDIRIECNTLTLQERMVLKTLGGSI